MPAFHSNGVEINYVDEGEGPPVVLVHGFASSLDGNWRAPPRKKRQHRPAQTV